MSKINKIILILAILSIFMLIPSAFALDDSNILSDTNENTLSDTNSIGITAVSASSNTNNPELSHIDESDEDYNQNLSLSKVTDSIIADSNSIYVSNNGNDDGGDGSESNPYKTISKAIEVFDSSSNSNIFIKNGEYNFTERLDIEKDMTIVGESNEGVILNGNGNVGFFTVDSYNVQFNSLSFINSFSESSFYGSDGAINGEYYRTLIIDNCIFKNNIGGAICSSAGSSDWYPAKMIVNNSIFINNTKTGSSYDNGGAISVGGIYSSLNLTNSIFINNSASNGGGAVSLNNGRKESEIKNCQFISNTANEGSAVYISNGYDTSILKSSFINNTAEEGSGAIDYSYSYSIRNLSLSNNEFSGNSPEDLVTGDNIQIVNLDCNDKISASDINMNNGEDINFTVSLKDSSNNPLSGKMIYLTLTDYFGKETNLTSLTDENGEAIFPLINQSAGTYTAVSSFKGDDDYDEVETMNSVKIKSNSSYNIYFSENPLKVNAGDSYNITGITCDDYMIPVVLFTSYTVSWTTKSGGTRTTTGGVISNSRFTVDVNNFDLEINKQYYYINFTASSQLGNEAHGTLIIDTSVPLPPVDRDIDIIYVSNDGSDEIGDGSESNPLKTLPVALFVNEEFGGNKTIFLNEGRYGISNLEIYQNVTIVGVKSKSIIYQNAADNGMLFLDNNATVRFANVTFTDGLVSEYTLYMCVIVVRYPGSVAYFDECEFYNNTASSDGMLYIANNAEAYITNCIFEDNIARTFNPAGAVHVQGAYMFMNNTVFRNNTATEGGALFIGGDSRVEIYNSLFDKNIALNDTSALSGGGAVFINNWDNYFYNCTFTDNYAELNGGAIYILTGYVDIDRCYFENNHVLGGGNSKGSAIAEDSAYTVQLYVENSILISNDTNKLVYIMNDYAEENEVILNNNYWGSNSYQSYDNWVIINASVEGLETDAATDESFINQGELTEITVRFVDKNNEELLKSVHDYLLYVNPSLGAVDKDSIIITDNMAKFNYYPNIVGNESITLSNNKTRYVINFTVRQAGKTDLNGNICINDNRTEIIIELPTDIEKNITIIIDNESIPYKPNGSVSRIGVDLLPGNHSIRFSYEGDDKYNAFVSEEINVEIDKWDAKISIISEDAIVGENIQITVTADSRFTDTIMINVNNRTYPLSIVNGSGSRDLDSLSPGKYDIKAIFNGNSYFNADEDSINITVRDTEITELFVDGINGNDLTGNGTSESPYATIAQALNRNKNLGGGKIIHVKEGNYTLNRYAITNDVAILGEGNVIISANDTNHIYIAGDVEVELSGLSFINGNGIIAGSIDMGSDDNGNLNKKLTIYNCGFINNTGLIGAISSYANTTIISSRFINNTGSGKTGFNQAIISLNDNAGTISYNVFMDNKYENNIIVSGVNSSALMNFWGSNERPSNYIENLDLSSWAVLIPSISYDIRTKTDYDLKLRFVGTEDGITYEELEGTIPEVIFNLDAALGNLNQSSVEIKNNEGIVNYNVNAKGLETISVILNGETIAELSFSIDVPEYDKIYVSNNGNDSNSGAREDPLATIAKALEMNKANGANKTIVILNGTYSEHNLIVDAKVNITSEGATIDAGQSTLFTISADVEIHNLSIINGNEAIKHQSGILNICDSSFINNTKAIISNEALGIYECIFNENNGIAIDSNSSVIIENCEFIKNSGDYLIKVISNNANGLSNGLGIGVSSDNNKGNALGIGPLYENELNAIIINSIFIQNSESISTIYIQDSNAMISENEFDGDRLAISIKNSEAEISGNKFNESPINISSSNIDLINNLNTTINVENSKLSNLIIEFLNNETVICTNGTIKLNASVTDDMGNSINGGKVIFTSNGESIGNATSSNGIAEFSYGFTKGNYTISGGFDCANNPTVNTGLLRVDVDYYWFINDKGYENLSDAIDAAEPGDVIKGLAGSYNIDHQLIGHRYFSLEPWEIIKSVTITSLNETPVTLVGTSNQMFFIDVGSELTLENIIIKDAGSYSEDGGAIESLYETNLTIINCSFINNTGENGGALNIGGNLYIRDSLFDSNNALLGGAIELIALHYSNEKIIMDNVSFINNHGKYSGALYIGGSEVELNNTSFINNSASIGGAIQIMSGSLKITDSEFIGNEVINDESSTVQSYGGAIYNYLANLTIDSCNFTNNSAEGLGGALELENGLYGDITWTIIRNSNFTGNYAGEGGAIYLGTSFDPYVEITNSIFDSNTAGSNGGAIVDNGGHVFISASEFTNNNAIDGYDTIHVIGDLVEGEAYYGEMSIVDSIFHNNNADYSIFTNNYGNLSLSSCEFINEESILFNRGNSSLSKVVAENISSYAIENNGLLSLSENVLEKTILNNNRILSTVYIVILNNETKSGVFNSSYTLKAQLTDDNNNIIEKIDLIFVIENEEINASYDNDSLSYTAEYYLPSGDHLVNAKTNATGYDELKVKTGILSGKDKPVLNVTIVKAVVGEDVVISIEINPDAEGEINVTIANTGESFRADIINGTAVITIPELESGNYEIEVSYKGDDKYAESIEKANLTVSKITDYPIEINVTSDGQSAEINVILPDDVNGNVSLVIDGNEIIIPVTNGKSNITIADLDAGQHNITVIFDGNDKYAKINKTSGFSIGKLSSFVSINVENIDLGQVATIELTVPKDAIGDILVTIDGKNYLAHITEGEASVSVSDLANGTYAVNAEYYGDSRYLNSSNKTSFTVYSPTVETGFSLIHIISIDENYLITGVLKDQSNKPISNAEIIYTADGNEKTAMTDADGIFKVQALANSLTVIEYKGTDLISGTNTSIQLSNKTVTRKATGIICSDMTTTAINYLIDGRYGEYFLFKLVDSYGNPLANKPITVGFNGHAYNRTTDENGSAKLQINLAIEGGYTFAVCFLGDDDYNGSFTVAKITVVKQSPKLSTSSKTYKASAKTKTLTATFKTSRGTALKGKKISFTVNGKTYTGTTNAKGVATVKVSLSKKGTYSFTAKFAGDSTYKAISKKATLKLK